MLCPKVQCLQNLYSPGTNRSQTACFFPNYLSILECSNTLFKQQASPQVFCATIMVKIASKGIRKPGAIWPEQIGSYLGQFQHSNSKGVKTNHIAYSSINLCYQNSVQSHYMSEDKGFGLSICTLLKTLHLTFQLKGM